MFLKKKGTANKNRNKLAVELEVEEELQAASGIDVHRGQQMNLEEIGDAPDRPQTGAENDDELDIRQQLASKRNRLQKANIFGAESRTNDNLYTGQFQYGHENKRIDYESIAAENRKAAFEASHFANTLIVKTKDEPEEPMNEEQFSEKVILQQPPQNGRFFKISTEPEESNRPVKYNVVNIDHTGLNDLDVQASRNQLELNRIMTNKIPSIDEEFEDTLLLPQELYEKQIVEDFRIRKLEMALEEHKMSNKSK